MSINVFVRVHYCLNALCKQCQTAVRFRSLTTGLSTTAVLISAAALVAWTSTEHGRFVHRQHTVRLKLYLGLRC